MTGAWGEELKGGGGRGRTGILTSRGRGGTRKEVELKISCLVWCLTFSFSSTNQTTFMVHACRSGRPFLSLHFHALV